MEGYYGFNNQELLGYLGAGLTMQQLQQLQEILPQFSGMVDQNAIGQQSLSSDYDLARQLASQGGGGPMGGANTLENIQAGLGYLQQHPKGSRFSGETIGKLGSDIGGVITGGMVDFSKGRFNVPYSSAQMRNLGKSYANTFTGGQFREDINRSLDSPEARMAGSALGMGAGMAAGGAIGAEGGLGSFAGQGYGAAQSPYYAGMGPEGLPMLADPATGYVAQNVAFDAAGMAGPGAGIGASGITGATGIPGGMGGAGGSSGTQGAQLGGMAVNFANMLGGGSPLSMPQSVGGVGGAGGAQGLTQPQMAALGAQQSEAHRGLAPNFQARMAGKQEQPGLANSQDLSLAALYGLGGGR